MDRESGLALDPTTTRFVVGNELRANPTCAR